VEKDHIIIIIGTNGENPFQRGKEQETPRRHPTPSKHNHNTTSQKYFI
jgi:hypothetical protein